MQRKIMYLLAACVVVWSTAVSAINFPTYKLFSLPQGRVCIQTTGLVLLNDSIHRQSFPVNCGLTEHLIYSPIDREWPQVLVFGVEYYRFIPLVSVSMVHQNVTVQSDMPVLNGEQIVGSALQHTHYQERISIQTIKYGAGTYLNLKTGTCTKVITNSEGRAVKKQVTSCPKPMSTQEITVYNERLGDQE
ncbi:hypothetical protein AB6D11_00220 [Vibrio splendidus]